VIVKWMVSGERRSAQPRTTRSEFRVAQSVRRADKKDCVPLRTARSKLRVRGSAVEQECKDDTDAPILPRSAFVYVPMML
jgi:hypothetical protein